MNPFKAYRRHQFRKRSEKRLATAMQKVERFQTDSLPRLTGLETLTDEELEQNPVEEVKKELGDVLTTIAIEVSGEEEPSGNESVYDLIERGLTRVDYSQLFKKVENLFENFKDEEQNVKAERKRRRQEEKRKGEEDKQSLESLDRKLVQVTSEIERTYGPLRSVHSLRGNAYYIDECRGEISDVRGLQRRAEGVTKEREVERIHSDYQRTYFLGKVKKVTETLAAFLDKLEKAKSFREEFRRAIIENDHEKVQKLHKQRDCNLSLVEPAPTHLMHGLNPIKPGKDGSWEYATTISGSSSENVYSPQEYVDVLERIMVNGLRASERRHGNTSDRDHPAIYFHDARVDARGYGGAKIIVDTSEMDRPVFRRPTTTSDGNWEYIIFTPELQADFELELWYFPTLIMRDNLLDPSEREQKEFYLGVAQELEKRGILFKKHHSFLEMEREREAA